LIFMAQTKEQQRAWRAANPELVAARNARVKEKYHTDPDAKARRVLSNERWRKSNAATVRNYKAAYARERMKDPIFRAAHNARTQARRGKYPTEASVENYLVDLVKVLGGLCIKFVDPGRRGAPDRIVCLPGHPSYFVELKRPKLGRLDAHQARYHDALRSAGQKVWVIWSKEGVDGFFAEI